jgi:SsrA-binding protein
MTKVKSVTKSKEFFNKKARFNYAIEESFEVGIVLTGPEIKAVRAGRVNISSAHIRIMSGEMFLLGAIINALDGEADRTRKLLAKKEEISRLTGKTEEKGLTIVPIKMYFTRGRLKLEAGLGRGKKKFDKRETIKKREQERLIEGDFLRGNRSRKTNSKS